jgi:tRNA(Arg) A34 adenosine deaminase TadA
MTDPDAAFLDIAVAMARRGLAACEFTVGAVLVNGSSLVLTEHNRNTQHESYLQHAEMRVLAAAKQTMRHLVLYTTLEPCLACLSASALCRVKRVVFACRDPISGASHLEAPGAWYREVWPLIEQLSAREEVCAELLLEYTASRPSWRRFQQALIGEKSATSRDAKSQAATCLGKTGLNNA